MTRSSAPWNGALALVLALVCTCASLPALAQFQPPHPSPKGTVTQTIGVTDVSVSYSRPLVKGRKIWGELVPLGKPWRTGANEATTVTFGDDVVVEGKKLAEGTYALVTIPGKDEWTVAFNLDTALWIRTSYNAALDVLRVSLKPEAGEFRESLGVSFENVGAYSAKLVLSWEKLRVPLTIQVDTKGLTLEKAHEAVAKAKVDDWETPLAVARYLSDEKVNPQEAMALVDKSIALRRVYQNVSRKARMLAQEGKFTDAVKAGEEAVQFGKTSPDRPNLEAFEKLIAEWRTKK